MEDPVDRQTQQTKEAFVANLLQLLDKANTERELELEQTLL